MFWARVLLQPQVHNFPFEEWWLIDDEMFRICFYGNTLFMNVISATNAYPEQYGIQELECLIFPVWGAPDVAE